MIYSCLFTLSPGAPLWSTWINISPKSLERRRLVFDLADQERHCPKSRPILDDIHATWTRNSRRCCEESGRPSHFPSLSKREALSSTVRMTSSRSNRAERSLRGVVLVETTDCSSAAKGQTAAVLNGLIAICKRLPIDPFAWNVLVRSATTEATAKPKQCFPANRRPSP